MFKLSKVMTQLAIVLSLFGLVACDDDDSVVTAQPPVWTAGVFGNQNDFINQCQSPRAGTDLNGNLFPDLQGSTLHENFFLRSWSNNIYLWYNEITDLNPANYSTTEEYFDLLKTEATTQSGAAKDQYHFTYASDVWQQLNQAGVSTGYGVYWAIIESVPPRELRVAYTEPNSPAVLANLARGVEILEIDDIDMINNNTRAGVDALNAGLFPSTEGEQHRFLVRDVETGNTRTVAMISANITSVPVQNVTTIVTPSGKVGYLLFNAHIQTAETGLIDAVTELSGAGIADLVLDLRYNGGGILPLASELSYMIAGPTATAGKNFETLTFNDKHPTINPVTGQTITPSPFYNTSLGFSVTRGQALPGLNLSRVFILSTARTCSASESIINGLRGIDVEVILIGSTTCGKPYGFYPMGNCGTTYFTIQTKMVNDKYYGDYSDGFSPANTLGTVGEVIPGCSVADDFLHALGDSQEGLLAAALAYRDSGQCPIPTGKMLTLKGINKNDDRPGSLFNSERYRHHQLLKENRILDPTIRAP